MLLVALKLSIRRQYQANNTDAGLHRLGMILTVAAVVLLAATLADRSLARQVRA